MTEFYKRTKSSDNFKLNKLFIFFPLSMVLLAIIGGHLSFTNIPYWDMWDGSLIFLNSFKETNNIKLFWTQHNEHRIVLSKVLFLVNEILFDSNYIFLIFINYLIIFIISAFFIKIFLNYAHDLVDFNFKYYFCCIIVAWIFQWMQSQNITWAFQSQFLLVQLLPLFSFYLISNFLIDKNLISFYLSLFFAILSVGTMANGVIVLPLLTLFLFEYKKLKFTFFITLLLSIFSISFYFYDYISPPSHGNVVETLFNHPLLFIKYSLTYLGSPFHHLFRGFLGGGLAIFFGFLLITIFIILIFRYFKNCNNINCSLLHKSMLFYLTFIILSSLATAGGRAIFGSNQALDSRYTTPAIISWVLIAILNYKFIYKIYVENKKFSTVAILFYFILFLMFTLQFRALNNSNLLNYKLAGLAAGLNIDDTKIISEIYPNSKVAIEIATKSQQLKTSIYRKEPFTNTDYNNIIFQYTTTSPANYSCIGAIDKIIDIENITGYSKIYGWIYNYDKKNVPEYIYIFNNGTLIGKGVVGFDRPDVSIQHGKESYRSGFIGYIYSKNNIKNKFTITDLFQDCYFSY